MKFNALQNNIEKIENLQPMTNLNFLTLSSNKIQEISGLKFLDKLKFLDLSNNFINDYDPGWNIIMPKIIECNLLYIDIFFENI